MSWTLFVPWLALALLQRGDILSYDRDADGRISPVEFSAWLFYISDGSRDGFLDDEEVKNFRFGNANRGDQKIPAKFWKDLDRDGDGKVSRKEFQTPPKFFEGWDKNGDGFLDDTELMQRGGPKVQDPTPVTPADFLRKADSNGDGKIARDEWERLSRGAFFDKADKNQDGTLTLDEMTIAFNELRREGYLPSPPTFVERFDLNGDGKIARSEFPGPDEIFQRLDANGDGVISNADGSGKRAGRNSSSRRGN